MDNQQLKYIEKSFDDICSHLKKSNDLGCFNMARKCEDLFCQLFNIIMDWNLLNLNTIKKNHPAVDLGDGDKKISMQVTTRQDKQKKVKEILDTFKRYRLLEEYKQIYFFSIDWEQYKHLDALTEEDPKLTCWSLSELYSLIENSSKAKQDECTDIIHKYIDEGLTNSISESNDEDFLLIGLLLMIDFMCFLRMEWDVLDLMLISR